MHAAKMISHLDNLLDAEQVRDHDVAFAKLRFSLLRALIEQVTGKDLEVYDAEELSASIERLEENQQGNNRHWALKHKVKSAPAQLIYRSHNLDDGDNMLELTAQASIHTLDGSVVELELNALINEDLLQSDLVHIRNGHAHLESPVTSSFHGYAEVLTGESLDFDIELAGTQQAYHDYDDPEEYGMNSEFEDDYDYDITEDSELVGQLKVWVKDQHGDDYLFALGEASDDTIFIGQVNGAVQLVAEREVVTGQLSGDGFFIDDNGEAGQY